MQTSCPECGTTFRVSQQQLGMRRGLVRCGHCNAVFNGYDTLLPELEEPPLAQPAEDKAAVAATPEVAGSMPDADSHAGAPGGDHAAEDSMAAHPLTIIGQDVVDVPGDAEEVPAVPAAEATRPVAERPGKGIEEGAGEADEQGRGEGAAESPEAILLAELPHRLEVSRPRLPAWKMALYLLTAAVLVLGLLGQLAYFLRGDLAAAVPDTRPWLDALCRPLNCVVPLPQQLTREAIVSSSLEHDTEQKSRVHLSFLLANRTALTQAWPHIILTLSDVRESPVAQQAFAPELYLPTGVSAKAGFPPQSEQEARLDLDIGGLAASSYVLNIAYP